MDPVVIAVLGLAVLLFSCTVGIICVLVKYTIKK